MNHMETVARRKAGGNEAWEFCAWERVGEDGVIVEGGIPRVLKSGPRKGKKTWRDMPTQKVVVTVAEIDAEHARYEADTGKCGDCFGKGREFARWSQANGVEMKECGRCKGTGIAPSNSVIMDPALLPKGGKVVIPSAQCDAVRRAPTRFLRAIPGKA